MKNFKEKIEEITGEYGYLHQEDCDINNEGGSYEGCNCAMKNMIKEVVEFVVEFLSHDITFKNEEQRKSAVKMYLEDFKLN